MRIVKQVQILLGLALLGAARLALADGPTADSATTAAMPVTVVVVGAAESTWNCNEANPARARWLADKASRDGAYQRAGECYLAAGEPALADRAFVKASALTSVDTSHKLAANLDDVEAQMRQLKAVFRHQ